MAAQTGSKPGSSSQKNPHLEGFSRLGAKIYLQAPDQGSLKENQNELSTEDPPDVIILCAWMGAGARPIAKYVAGDVALFPNAQILLLRSTVADLAFRSVAAQVHDLEPAAKAIKKLADEAKTSNKKFRVLAHVFSNGGSWSICALKLAYARLGAEALPINAMVIDSAPSLPRVRPGYNAMMEALPKIFLVRLVARFVFWILLGLYYIAYKLRLQANIIITLRQMLNDTKGPFLAENVPRTYICSKHDAMVPIEDVLDHAAEAKEQLEKIGSGHRRADLIIIEEFTGIHVGHMMIDAERYWKIIVQTWSRAK